MAKNTHRPSTAARRFGYGVAIAMNVVGMVVVNNLLDWDWIPFLTDEFSKLLPIVNVSFAANIAANAAYMVHDSARFKSISQLGLNAISLVAIVRTLQVFPFDFTEHSFNWSLVARIVLIVGIVGTVAGSVVELVKLSRYEPARSSSVS